MTLEELITTLEAADPTLVLPYGFTNPHSYRGYYHELAFEPATDITVGSMLADARSALGTTYTGWKGGTFTMQGYTDCWLAQEGSAGGETLGLLLLNLMLAAGIRDTACAATGCGCGQPTSPGTAHHHSLRHHMNEAAGRQGTGPDDSPAHVGRCPVMLQGGGRCEKQASHRPPGSDDPHTPQPPVRERVRLAIAQQWLADTGSGRTVDELDDAEFGDLADAALRALVVEQASPADELESAARRLQERTAQEPNPSLAHLLADGLGRALETAASMVTVYPDLGTDHDRDACADYTCALTSDLLTVARTINGSQP
ncbi:hypothetical protein ACFRFJ_15785 [Streptomyces hydrogenans]|uniref:hypothetical protein n=1 Tax=Streptomyces hydrogenans TaxID=1873719 RepID=UPI00369647C8